MIKFLKLLFSRSVPDAERSLLGASCGAAGIFFNAALFLSKIIAGVISGSLSVCADALNNLTDAASSVVSLLGFKISSAEADSEHPLGHARAEYVSGLIVSILIIIIGFELLRSSVSKLFSPSAADFSPALITVLVISVLVKILMFCYNMRAARLISSETLRATAMDSRNDVIATSSVIVCALLSRFFSLDIDAPLGAAIALFITAGGIKLVKETSSPLLGEAADAGTVEKIREKILSYDGVLGAHDLIMHDYGASRRFASVHVELPGSLTLLSAHEIIDNIERDFMKNEGINLIVHSDPAEAEGCEQALLRELLEKIAHGIHPGFTLHDIKLTPEGERTLVEFDCVKPAGCALSDEAVADVFKTELQSANPKYTLRVTVDSSFAPIQHF